MDRKSPHELKLAPHGVMTELARLSGCCRKTVYNALRRNSGGVKASRIRELYRARYVENR